MKYKFIFDKNSSCIWKPNRILNDIILTNAKNFMELTISSRCKYNKYDVAFLNKLFDDLGMDRTVLGNIAGCNATYGEKFSMSWEEIGLYDYDVTVTIDDNIMKTIAAEMEKQGETIT